MANYRYTYDYNGRRYEIDAPKGSTAADLQRIVQGSGGAAAPQRPAAAAPKKKKEDESFLSGVIPTLKSATGDLVSDLGLTFKQAANITKSVPVIGEIDRQVDALLGGYLRTSGQGIKTRAEAEMPQATLENRARQQRAVAEATPGTGSKILAGIGKSLATPLSESPTLFTPIDYAINAFSRNFLPQTSEQAARGIATVQTAFDTPRSFAETTAGMLPATAATLVPGKLVQTGARAVLPRLGVEVSEAALNKAVRRGVVGSGATINASAAGSEAYDNVLAKGGTQEEANRAFQIAFAGAATTSAVAAKIPGLEQRVFAGQPARDGILRSAGRAAIGEAPQEFVEEAGSKLATNVGMLGTAAEVPIGEDVLSSGVMGAIGGATIAAPIGGLQGAFNRGNAEAGAPPPPPPPSGVPPTAPPPANMDDLAQGLGPVGGTVTLQDAFGPQEYTFQGFDKKGKVILTDADGVTLSEDPDWVRGAIKSAPIEQEEDLGGMSFGMDLNEDVAAPPPPPPPPPPPTTTGDEFVSNILDSKPVAPTVFSPDVVPPIFSPDAPKPKFTIDPAPIVEEPELPAPPPERVRTVRTPAGSKVKTAFEVVEAKDLTAATGDLQNRDRSRASTELQVQKIFAEFDPELLGESPESDRGSPIIGFDNVIESGNGRVMALNKVYNESPEKESAYRQFIEDQGFDTSGYERPILVRRRIDRMTPDQRSAFTRESNMDIKLQLSTSEKAQTDAASLTPDVMGLMASPDVSASANQGFVRAFLSKLPAQEQAAFIDKVGRLSADGIRRIRTAVKSSAYGDADLINTLDESQDNNIKSIGGALEDVAAAWRRMLDAIRDGKVDAEMDTTEQLVEAAKIVRDVRNKGMKIGDFLDQQDAFNPLDPVTERFIRSFYNETLGRAAGREAIADVLNKYVRRASEQTTGDGLFERESMSPVEILDGILDERGSGSAQSDLYASIAEPSTNLTDTPSSTDIMALADELPAAERVNVRSTLNKILSRYEKNGTIDQLLGGLEQLYIAVNNRIKRNREIRNRDRVRGFERAMERSYEAERTGKITPESAKLLRWLLQKNPAIAEELALSFEVGEDSDSAGVYSAAERVATIFSSKANDGTAVHEVLHHTERLLPEKIRDGVRAEWTKRIKNLMALAERTGNTDARQVLGTIVRAYYGDSAARKDLDESYAAGTIPYSMYHLSNPSEFWAVNATELVARRAQQTGWTGAARKWLEGFIEKAKDFFGLNSNSAVIKALDAVLNEESGKTRGEMIASGGRKLRKDANQKAQEEIEDNAQFRDIASLDEKRAEKKLGEMETIIKDLEKAMRDEGFSIPLARQAVGSLDRALNSLDDIDGNTSPEFNDRLDDLEAKILELREVANAALKPANANKPETEIEKAQREYDKARKAFNKMFYEDERASKDRRTKERKAYEEELEPLENAHDEALAKLRKLYREEDGTTEIDNDTQFRDIARPDEQVEEDFDTETEAEPTPAKLSRVRQSVNRLRTSATWSNIASQFSGARAVDQWLARSYGVESLPETDSFYSSFETYLSKKNGKLQQLRRKYVDPIDDAVGDAIKNGVTMDDINDAIQARGAAERNAGVAEINEDMPDGGSGMTNAAADAKLRELQASGKMRYINRVVRLHDRLRNETQDMMVRDGIIAAETMAEWKRKYPNYTPYKGWAPAGDMSVEGQEDPHADYGAYEKGAPVYSRVGGLGAKPVKAVKGRSSQAANSLYNMIADAEMFLEMGQRNQIALQLDGTYQSDPEAFTGLLKIYDKNNPKIIKGKAVKITDERAFKNGIRGFRNGEPFIIETAPNEEGQAVQRAFTNLDPMQLWNWFEKFLSVSAFFRSLNTRLNPKFWPIEFLRSIYDSWKNVYIEKGRKRSAAYGKNAAMKTWRYSRSPVTMAGVFMHLINKETSNPYIAEVKALTEEMVINGGAAGQEFAERAERVAKRMEAELKRMTATGVKAGYFETKEGFAKLIKAVNGINDFIDIVPRVAAYRALTEAKVLPKDAAQIALRSTLDMSKRGRFGRVIDGFFWYTTPSITNLTRKVTSLDSSTYRKMVLAQLSIGFALGMLNVMNAPEGEDGEDEYSKLPEWYKLTRLVVYYSPDKPPFVAPMGFLFAFERYVGGKMAEVLAGKISEGKAAVNIMTASQDIGAAFLSSLSPVVRSTEMRTLAPTMVAPIWDLNLNENFFKAPIYNEPFDDSEAQASRVKPTTPRVYKIIAEGLQEATLGYGRIQGGIDVSPDQLKYFVDQYAGGVGRLVGGAIEGDIEEFKKLNPFYFDPKLVEYAPMSRFYERRPEMKRAIAADKLADEGDSSERDFFENTSPVSLDSGVISAFKDAEKDLKDLRKEANEMDPKEYKAEQLRIMTDFNRAYNDAKKGNYSYTSSADDEEEDFIAEEEEGDE